MTRASERDVFGREGVFRRGSGPDGTWVEMPYSGIRTFLRRRPGVDFAGVDLAIYGVPFDLMTSGRSGARLGPSALREASTQLAWGAVWPWGFDPFDGPAGTTALLGASLVTGHICARAARAGAA